MSKQEIKNLLQQQQQQQKTTTNNNITLNLNVIIFCGAKKNNIHRTITY